VGQADTASLAASPHEDLGLDDDRPSQFLSNTARLLRRGGYVTTRNRHAVCSEEPFGVIFM